MILEGMASDRRNLFWTIAHIVLGFVCTLTPFALIGWFYFIFFTNFFKANRLLQQKKPIFFLMFFSYLISFEILDRMAKTSPFIPYELGKYFLVLMGILGIVSLGIRSKKGLWMALLITPAIFYDFSEKRVFFDIINYYLAPLAVGLGIAFTYRYKITENQLNGILKLIWLGCLASLFYTYIKTPDFDEISFDLKANFQTTAGHSSNQVATIFGLGMFLSCYSIFKRLKFSGKRILDIVIFFGFTFQGLLSFSRGGMIVGVIALVFLFFRGNRDSMKKSIQSTGKLMVYGILFVISMYVIFELTNQITGGNLLLRYQGETEGTLLGAKEVTADHLLSGRLGILEKDMNLWFDHLVTGVGCGSSRYLRDVERGEVVAAHVEFSRLLADHGFLGLIYAILFFTLPFFSWSIFNKYSENVISFILIFIAIATTFHAAMRTYVTPLLIILGSLRLKK